MGWAHQKVGRAEIHGLAVTHCCACVLLTCRTPGPTQLICALATFVEKRHGIELFLVFICLWPSWCLRLRTTSFTGPEACCPTDEVRNARKPGILRCEREKAWHSEMSTHALHTQTAPVWVCRFISLRTHCFLPCNAINRAYAVSN